jgi:hypothetical protein
VTRPRHPDKDLERILKEAEDRGWRVERGKRYYKIYCPCPEMHKKSVHLTPSDPGYRRNLLGQLGRATCWCRESDEKPEGETRG